MMMRRIEEDEVESDSEDDKEEKDVPLTQEENRNLLEYVVKA